MMWDLYNDDECFQRLARGRGFHDADLLAKVLYGKQIKKKVDHADQEEKKTLKDRKVDKPDKHNVQFRNTIGKMKLDSTILSGDEKEDHFDYLWRSQDYSFQPVKSFTKESDGVQTDVVLYDRRFSSEFDPEREELKDDLLAWNTRYKQRQEQEKNKLG